MGGRPSCGELQRSWKGQTVLQVEPCDSSLGVNLRNVRRVFRRKMHTCGFVVVQPSSAPQALPPGTMAERLQNTPAALLDRS